MHNVRAVSFSLFGDLLRTIAQEAASQRALRNCSKRKVGGQFLCDFGEGVLAVKYTPHYTATVGWDEQTYQLMCLVLF